MVLPQSATAGPALRFLAVSALRFSICAHQFSNGIMSARSSSVEGMDTGKIQCIASHVEPLLFGLKGDSVLPRI